MALNNAVVADIGFAHLVTAEVNKLHAYAAFTTLFVMNPNGDVKQIRKHLSVRAMQTGVIAKNTWESYVKGVETAAGMFRTHAADEVAAILDMAADEAVTAMRELYEGLNIFSGSDIRAWATAGEFLPLDKAAAKAAKAEANKVRALAKGESAAALFFAGNAADSSTIPDMASTPMTALATVLAAISTLGHADALVAMAALNDHVAMLDATVAALPAPTTAPVLADDADVHPLSALGRVTVRKAA